MTERAVGVTDVASGAGVADYRVRERSVSGATVCEQYLIPVAERVRSGVFNTSTGRHFINATAQAAGVGFWYLVNPVGSGTLVMVRRVQWQQRFASSSLAVATSPRMTLERFTYTGTPSGTLVTPSKAQSSQTALGKLYTTSTGMTITAGDTVHAWLSIVGFSGGTNPGAQSGQTPQGHFREAPLPGRFPGWLDQGLLVLAEGEGLLLRQPDAGTATESVSRVTVTNVSWEEYTVP